MYGNLTVKDLDTDHYQSATRNKLIAEAFYLTKDIEKYGSGFIRIRKEIKEYPTMIFTYKEQGDGFFASLSYEEQKIASDVGKDVGKDAHIRRQAILAIVRNNPKITIPEIAEKTGTTSRTIERDILWLREKSLLVREGGKKEGSWRVKSEGGELGS